MVANIRGNQFAAHPLSFGYSSCDQQRMTPLTELKQIAFCSRRSRSSFQITDDPECQHSRAPHGTEQQTHNLSTFDAFTHHDATSSSPDSFHAGVGSRDASRLFCMPSEECLIPHSTPSSAKVVGEIVCERCDLFFLCRSHRRAAES